VRFKLFKRSTDGDVDGGVDSSSAIQLISGSAFQLV
jgi:hypothetical protein